LLIARTGDSTAKSTTRVAVKQLFHPALVLLLLLLLLVVLVLVLVLLLLLLLLCPWVCPGA
jgi:hypothetical protein